MQYELQLDIMHMFFAGTVYDKVSFILSLALQWRL